VRYLIASITFLVLAACVAQQIEVGESRYLVIQKIQKERCILDGRKVNGSWQKFKTENMPVYKLCISLKSDNVERTLNHELTHVSLDAMGMDTTVIDW
jgi:hypothetical protein